MNIDINNNDNNLDLIFHALSDETRRGILARLCTGNRTILELAKPYDISLPAISKHIKVLEKAGLIVRGRDKQYRPISLNFNAFREIDQYLSSFRRANREFNEKLSKLGAEEFLIRK